ncbi:MAG: branched-chain amino acid ABC transporter ATP-binding protein [Desulfobulbaceae bacterium S3730MH12]|nr:MAG: branched-chain amino acid ABC transporter ATP-binding protein [Desulfobulbaceae bacterium S5133MH15]OEU54067.1 MAG: branched-chain amino acid ABC transporter ATP-binding protein [Desulfobulbaceae bacterium S3730MH12]OEU79023.1 MAG: branched-chain amino acid ABC transporter ATP-binding protein [Desulfobulbaceae bacterium C00003063]
MSSRGSLIRLENISKSFGKVLANRDVTLEIMEGKILALLGENGAGKSTLMSILAGQMLPDTGTIYLGEKPVQFSTTEKAISAGIGMVYQHFKLVDAMTVAENVFLGQKGGFWLKKKKMSQMVEQLADQYGMKVDPGARISDLSMGEKQQVEILKLLHRKSTVLIFDEPTAVLTPNEAENLFATMKIMVKKGKGIVFISHKLEEVMTVADNIAILRRGEIVDRVAASDVSSTAELAERMVGREVLLQVDKEPVEPRQIVLRLKNLSGPGLKKINLELRQGEILAIVGVAGNGQKPLVEAICGLSKPPSDTVTILGMEWRKFFRKAEWDNALSYIPEDRQGLATCQGLDLLDNFLLTTRGGFTKGPWLRKEVAREKASYLIEEFDIRPPDLDIFAWQLSGGNLQKMVLAREFYRKPRLIVAEQPTQGLDIAATEDVWNLLLKAREQAGILLVTGDLNEAFVLSDRIGVMYNGKIVETFDTDNKEKLDQIPQMMAGLAVA